MTTMSGFAVYAFCMFGCALTAFHLGRQTGIEAAVNYLISTGVLEVEDEE